MIKAMAHKLLGAVVFGLILGAGLTATALAADGESGFLKDYSQLTEGKDLLGNTRRVWISPKFTRENYNTILMEKVSFYPAPQPSEQVPQSTLTDIRDYGDKAIRQTIASVLPMTGKPGPGVARVRIALTAVSVDKSLKPYQLIPTALIFTAITRATGAAKLDAKLFVESEITDSVTGEPLAKAVRHAEGVEVKADQKLTLDLVRSRIDAWAEATGKEMTIRIKAAGK
jgi:hypothetical protein